MMQEVAAAAPAVADKLALYKTPQIHLLEDHAKAHTFGSFVEQLFFRTSGQNATAVYTDGVFLLVLWFSVFFFILLMGLMIYWVIKYRRRPGVPAEISPSHNGPLEILWTVVPSSSLLVIFLLGFWGYMDKLISPADAMQLRVTGKQWDWSVEYPEGQQSAWFTTMGTKNDSVPIYVIPEETDIRLMMTSQDVIHAFWVPDYRTKIDLYPNRYTTYSFKTEKLRPDEDFRDHWIFCAEFCGDRHSEMYGLFRVVRKDVYDDVMVAWGTGSMTPVQRGQLIYKQQCVACHTVDGSALIGPSWKNLYGHEVALSGGGTVIAEENYIEESVFNPTAKIVAGFEGQNMTNFTGILKREQVADVIAYMKTLSDKGGASAEQGEQPAGEQPAEGAEGGVGEEGSSGGGDEGGAGG